MYKVILLLSLTITLVQAGAQNYFDTSTQAIYNFKGKAIALKYSSIVSINDSSTQIHFNKRLRRQNNDCFKKDEQSILGNYVIETPNYLCFTNTRNDTIRLAKHIGENDSSLVFKDDQLSIYQKLDAKIDSAIFDTTLTVFKYRFNVFTNDSSLWLMHPYNNSTFWLIKDIGLLRFPVLTNFPNDTTTEYADLNGIISFSKLFHYGRTGIVNPTNLYEEGNEFSNIIKTYDPYGRTRSTNIRFDSVYKKQITNSSVIYFVYERTYYESVDMDTRQILTRSFKEIYDTLNYSRNLSSYYISFIEDTTLTTLPATEFGDIICGDHIQYYMTNSLVYVKENDTCWSERFSNNPWSSFITLGFFAPTAEYRQNYGSFSETILYVKKQDCLIGFKYPHLVGLSKNVSDNDILMYPNPAAEYIDLKVKNNDFLLTKYRLLTSKGILIQERNIDNYNSDILSINIGNLESGVYFLLLETNNFDRVLKKIMIQR